MPSKDAFTATDCCPDCAGTGLMDTSGFGDFDVCTACQGSGKPQPIRDAMEDAQAAADRALRDEVNHPLNRDS